MRLAPFSGDAAAPGHSSRRRRGHGSPHIVARNRAGVARDRQVSARRRVRHDGPLGKPWLMAVERISISSAAPNLDTMSHPVAGMHGPPGRSTRSSYRLPVPLAANERAVHVHEPAHPDAQLRPATADAGLVPDTRHDGRPVYLAGRIEMLPLRGVRRSTARRVAILCACTIAVTDCAPRLPTSRPPAR